MAGPGLGGRGRMAVSDLVHKMSAGALILCAVALFLGGALGGVSMIGRLGGAGLAMYVVVIGTYALLFGPVIAAAVLLHKKGSARHRAVVARRREEQLRHFGLHSRRQPAATSPSAEIAREASDRKRSAEAKT